MPRTADQGKGTDLDDGTGNGGGTDGEFDRVVPPLPSPQRMRRIETIGLPSPAQLSSMDLECGCLLQARCATRADRDLCRTRFQVTMV